MISEVIPKPNPNCAETFASLRLFGDALQPEAITRLLQFQPTDAAPKGWQTVSPSGKRRTAPTGRWVLESTGHLKSKSLAEHIGWLLDRLESTGLVPLEMPGVSCADVFCYWVSATGQGGPEFPPQLLGRLARLGLTLGLDIYFDSSSS